MSCVNCLCSLVLLMSFISGLRSQDFKEGEFHVGLISFESEQMPDTSSLQYKKALKALNSQFKVDVSYNSERIVFSETEGTKVVLDFENNKSYEFRNVNFRPFYFVDSISNEFNIKTGILEKDKSSFGDSTFIENYKFGLDCWRYVSNQAEGILTIYVTNNIVMPGKSVTSRDPLEIGSVVETIVDDYEGNKVVFGMTAFTDKIKDRSVFLIDTFNNDNGTNIVGLELTLEEQIKLERDQYGDYQEYLIDKDIIQQLVDEKALDPRTFRVRYALKNNCNYDVPNILMLGKGSRLGFAFMPRQEVLNIFTSCNIMGPTLEYLLTDDSILWDNLSTDFKYNAICIAAIKDHLLKPRVRKQTVENLFTFKYIKSKNSLLDKAFINGDYSYSEYFNKVNVLQKLREGYLANDIEIYETLKEFFELAFHSDNISISYSMIDNLMKLKTESEIYEIDINDLKAGDYFDSSENSYGDSIIISEAFYSKPLNVLKQIATDNNKSKTYSIYHLKAPFTDNFDVSEYSEVIEEYPQLNINIDAFYLNTFSKYEWDWFNGFGMSFPYHPSGPINHELQLPSLKLGDSDAESGFLTSQVKRDFFKFIELNDVGLNISDENLENLKIQSNNTLYKNPYEFICQIDHISLRFSSHDNYPVHLTKERPFKEIYGSLCSFLDNKCENWIVKKGLGRGYVVETNDGDIEFEYKHELIEKVLKKMDLEAIKVYPIKRTPLLIVEYILVTDEQREALETVFQVDLF